MPKARVLVVGLGPIGCSIARLALERKESIDVIGAVDINPDLRGRDLADVIGNHPSTGVTVQTDAKLLYREADIVLHATGSFLQQVKPMLIEICENKLDTISTNEELSYPWFSNAKIASELDAIAKKNSCTILGTGVNPGYVMDLLPVVLSGASTKVTGFQVLRILDATKRRLAFQKKVGLGMSISEFDAAVKSGRFGHVGLPESIALVSSALGCTLDKIEQKIEPKIAKESIETEHFGMIEKGKVIGVIQDAFAYSKARMVASYRVEMYAGAENARDEITLEGTPQLKMVIPGGTPGDIATAALVVNSIPRVMDSAAGLVTVKDLRPASSVFV